MLAAPRFAFLTVVSSFALAEMSDKTALATVALAGDHDWTGVWIGSTVGMVLADGLAIGVGTLLHQRLPEELLHVVASLLFHNALGWRWAAAALTVAVAVAAAVAQALRCRRTVPAPAKTPPGHR